MNVFSRCSAPAPARSADHPGALTSAPFSPVTAAPQSVSHDLTPLHDATRVLVNPHKGWYHHYPDNHPDKYRIARDADLLEFPGTGHVYIRLAWSYLEPKEGEIDWAVMTDVTLAQAAPTMR